MRRGGREEGRRRERGGRKEGREGRGRRMGRREGEKGKNERLPTYIRALIAASLTP